MSEHDWTVTPIPQPDLDRKHKATVDGLEVVVEQRERSTTWQVHGYLADFQVIAGGFGLGWKRTVDDAKAQAIAAAHRLYAAGVRGEKSYPVSCCDRLLPTPEDAERHEAEHVAELRYIHFCENVENPGGSVCGHWATQATVTDDPAAVTCPTCREWIGENLIVRAPRWSVQRTDEGGVTRWAVIDAIGEIQPAYHDDERTANERRDRLNADEEAMPGGGTVIHVTAQVDIEDGQEGRYVVGRGPIEDSPWWVVDLGADTGGDAPTSVFSFVDREDAIKFRDALNVGDTDTAARIRAAEERRRDEAEESER